MPIIKICEVCKKEFSVPPSRADKARACSNECGNKLRGESNKKRVVLACAHCQKPFETPLCNADRRIYCSYDCKHAAAEYRAKIAKANTGENNPMWNGGCTTHADGYLLTREPFHPYAVGGYVFAHRLVAEEELRNKDPNHAFLVKLGNQLYLKPSLDVHHIDCDKQNNEASNLLICTKKSHGIIHSGDGQPAIGTYWPTNITIFLR